MSIYVHMQSVLINILNLCFVALYEFLILLSTEFSPQVRQTADRQTEINLTMFQSFHTSVKFLRGISDDQDVAQLCGTPRSLRRLQGPTTGHILSQNNLSHTNISCLCTR